jgi:hypothetical protein
LRRNGPATVQRNKRHILAFAHRRGQAFRNQTDSERYFEGWTWSLDLEADAASTECLGELGPTDAPSSQSAARQLLFGAQESPKAASNDCNVPQSPTSQLDLGLQRTDIPQRGSGRRHKAVEIILKTTERGLYRAHFILLHLFNIIESADPNKPLVARDNYPC